MAFSIGEKQKKAATLLWKGYETPEIAAKIGVHRSTVWRWFQHEEMRKYTEKVFRRNRNRLLDRLSEEPRENKLFEALKSPNPWTVNAAANLILDRYTDAIMKD